MYCQNCGTKNRKNAKFCMNCGQLILKEQKKKKSLFIVCLSALLIVLSAIAAIVFLCKKDLASISDPMYTLGNDSLLTVWQIDNLSDNYITVEMENAIVYNTNGEKINFSYENYITVFPKEIPPHSHGYAYVSLYNWQISDLQESVSTVKRVEHGNIAVSVVKNVIENEVISNRVAVRGKDGARIELINNSFDYEDGYITVYIVSKSGKVVDGIISDMIFNDDLPEIGQSKMIFINAELMRPEPKYMSADEVFIICHHG